MIWGFSAIMGGESELLGFWFFITVVGLVGMLVSAIGSWLAAP